MKRCAVSGYVVVTMLILLLGVGGAWLSIGARAKLQGATSISLSPQDRRGLVNARQALLSYAALYPYLYGPTGAGPAHLPCPDSNGYRQGTVGVEAGTRQRRDGPDPPCASLHESTGLLPRHTLLPGYRYLFHTESGQRYEYRVAGNLVNNPLNRVVNLQVLQSLAQEPVATISVPSFNIERTAALVTITGRSLISSSTASVAAWFLQRSMLDLHTPCFLSEDVAVVTHQATGSVRRDACYPPERKQAECKHDGPLALILDVPFVFSADCLDNSLASNSIEGVPALRHWFVRNQWYQSLTMTYHDACDPVQRSASSCILYLSPIRRAATTQLGSFIEFYWGMPL